ncbi:hypothetical protein C2S51_022023 [Perilla frutescens var. frutescens]|nr:hypothetical protein C2S51_022023 [Perilla frutescens var. frutescens]
MGPTDEVNNTAELIPKTMQSTEPNANTETSPPLLISEKPKQSLTDMCCRQGVQGEFHQKDILRSTLGGKPDILLGIVLRGISLRQHKFLRWHS